jgi:hypothetical protein
MHRKAGFGDAVGKEGRAVAALLLKNQLTFWYKCGMWLVGRS